MALGGSSLTAAIVHRAKYAKPLVAGSAEQSAAERLGIVQVATGAAFLAAVLYGVVDALLNYRAQEVTVRQLEPSKAGRLRLLPLGGFDVAGIGLGGRF